jgi:hypothetical protein
VEVPQGRETLRALLKANAQVPMGTDVKKGFENVAAIVVDALWYLHMSHSCLTGWSRLNNINATFNDLEREQRRG